MAKRVRQLLADAGETAPQLAKRLGDDRSAIHRVLRQERPIDLELVERLAAAFGLTPWSFLIAGSDPVWPLSVGDLDEDNVRRRFVRYVEAEITAASGKLEGSITQEALDTLKAAIADAARLEASLSNLLELLELTSGRSASVAAADDAARAVHRGASEVLWDQFVAAFGPESQRRVRDVERKLQAKSRSSRRQLEHQR